MYISIFTISGREEKTREILIEHICFSFLFLEFSQCKVARYYTTRGLDSLLDFLFAEETKCLRNISVGLFF